jgi:hypothetical protein
MLTQILLNCQKAYSQNREKLPLIVFDHFRKETQWNERAARIPREPLITSFKVYVRRRGTMKKFLIWVGSSYLLSFC